MVFKLNHIRRSKRRGFLLSNWYWWITYMRCYSDIGTYPKMGRKISSLVLLFGWKTCSYLVRGDTSNMCICSPHSCRIKNKPDYHFKNIEWFHQYWKLGRIRAFTILASMGNSIKASDYFLLSKETRTV